ncbi:MAG: Holliday junction branch migration protein RuvA [Actinomycetes bacterium]
MIATLSGHVKVVTTNSAVIEVGGVGLLVNLTPRFAATLDLGAHVTLHTSLLVREDSLTLFGFENSEAKLLFEILQTVTGIGPKVAQSALSTYEVPEIISAILSENLSLLERISGLGKKGAARLVLELKEKLSNFTPNSEKVGSSRGASWREQVEGALLNLGYTQRDTIAILDQLSDELSDETTTPEISILLRRALQIRGRTL